jgi:hypothetical protein
MSHNTETLLHTALVQLKAKTPKPRSWGLCSCVNWLAKETVGGPTEFTKEVFVPLRERLQTLMSLWPDADQDFKYQYPVGGPTEFSAALIAGTFWDNPRRHQLLDWLIDRTAPKLKRDRVIAELKVNGGNFFRAAKVAGCHYKYAQMVANSIGLKGVSGRKRKIDWTSVDWSKDSQTIAAEYGVHRSSVDSWRRAIHGRKA